MLDLVDHYCTAQTLKGGQRLRKAGQARGALKIKVIGRALCDDTAGQGGFAALARAYERDHAAALKCAFDAGQQLRSFNHGHYRTMKFLHIVEEFHGYYDNAPITDAHLRRH